MINEILEVSEYMEGKNIIRSNLYRICYLIIKKHKADGLTRLQSREKLFAWGAEHHVYIHFNVNHIINTVWEIDKRSLCADECVYVTDAEVKEIGRRFDSRKTKLVALAMLCYAKAHADDNGVFAVSMDALAAWVGLSTSAIAHTHIPELINYEYVHVENDDGKLWHTCKRKRGARQKTNRYKINILFERARDGHAVGNDIVKAFNTLFCA